MDRKPLPIINLGGAFTLNQKYSHLLLKRRKKLTRLLGNSVTRLYRFIAYPFDIFLARKNTTMTLSCLNNPKGRIEWSIPPNVVNQNIRVENIVTGVGWSIVGHLKPLFGQFQDVGMFVKAK